MTELVNILRAVNWTGQYNAVCVTSHLAYHLLIRKYASLKLSFSY